MGILPAATLVEKGSHLSRWDLEVPVVFPTGSLGPRFLEESLTLQLLIAFSKISEVYRVIWVFLGKTR